jgi:hypothetical protein
MSPMTASCPACGAQTNAEGVKPGASLTCSGCNQPFRLNMPAGEELFIAEQEDDQASTLETVQSEAVAGTVLCPICKTSNPDDAKVCSRCGALLRRKQWDKTVSIPSTVATIPARRRPLTLLLLFVIVVGLVGGLIWMAGRLMVAVETPSLAYRRIAGMAANGDWDRFCDRVHPNSQRVLTSVSGDNRPGPAAFKQMFANTGFGEAFMSIEDLPYKNFNITMEEVQGDRAILTVKSEDGRLKTVILVKDEGIWKLTLSNMERDFGVKPYGGQQ